MENRKREVGSMDGKKEMDERGGNRKGGPVNGNR